MKILILVLVFLILSCEAFKKNDEVEIIYLIANSKNVTIYNMTRRWVTSEDILYLNNRNYQYGEFGGEFEFCSNEDFYCLAGGINIAIPKKLSGQNEWEYKSRVCRAAKPLSAYYENIIECENNNDVVRFAYSEARGVFSYVMLDDKKRERTLLEGKGLFAK